MSRVTQDSATAAAGPNEQDPLLSPSSRSPPLGEAAEHDGSNDYSTQQLLRIFSGVWVGGFFAAIDITLIATLAVPISEAFGSGSLISWLASAYFIANGALQPLAGKLTDITSRRAGLLLSNIVFGVGNLICGLATQTWIIILGRAVAGAGGGGLLVLSQFVTSDLVPLRRRGMWSGFSNICYGVGAAFGGVAGGWINDQWGWRWAFLAQLPFTAVATLMIWATDKGITTTAAKIKVKDIDFAGATSLTAALFLFLFAANLVGIGWDWYHPVVLILFATSTGFFVLFSVIEAFIAPEPIIPIRLLLKRTVAVACLANWLSPMSHFGLLFYAPVYFQLRGMTTTEAGVALTPSSAGICTGSIVAGIMMRKTGRYYLLNLAICLVFALSYVLPITFGLQTPLWQPLLALITSGFGYSGLLTVVVVALIASVENKEQAVMTSASYAFRSTGSAVGMAIASVIFQSRLTQTLQDQFDDRNDMERLISRAKHGLAAIESMPEDVQGLVVEAYVTALRAVFTFLSIAALLTLITCLFLREHKLYVDLARREALAIAPTIVGTE